MVHMKVFKKIIKDMDKVLTAGNMEINTLDSGKMIKKTDKALIILKMVENM